MEPITENDIKHCTLGFLKTYYRYRPRIGSATASLDQRGDGGIIVDGYLNYLQEDNLSFTASFEATSWLTKGELKYKVQKEVLFWDSLTVAFIGSASWFTYSYIKDIYTIKDIGYPATIAILVGSLLGLMLFYRLFFSRLQRYRYIYAIEQFKRYFANEQWVAYGEDVFLDSNNKYFKELRKQCIYNGFGLIQVDKNLQAQLLVTPSRQDLFKSKRKVVQLFDFQDLGKIMESNTYLSKWLAFQRKLTDWYTFGHRDDLLRFQKNYAYQMVLCGISFALISGIFYKELQDPTIVYVDEEAYAIAMAKQRAIMEPMAFKLDTPYVYPAPYVNPVPAYLDIIKDKEPELLSNYISSPEILIYRKGKQTTSYDCSRFYTFTGTKYLLVAGRHKEIEPANRLVSQLSEMGVNAQCIWMGCFSFADVDYVVYLDEIFNERWETRTALRKFDEFFAPKRIRPKLSISEITVVRD